MFGVLSLQSVPVADDGVSKACSMATRPQPLQAMHEDHGHTQNAKALAILEVKDAVIERLEDELNKAELEVGHYEELARQAVARADLATETQIEATKGELAALRAASSSSEFDINVADSDCDILAKMAEQAERRAQNAEEDVEALKRQSSDAKRKVELLTDELAASMFLAVPSENQDDAPQKVKT